MDHLAFDLGGSGGKLFRGRFDGERLRLAPVHAFANRIVEIGGALYWDFPAIWENLIEGIGRARAQAEIASIGIDGFNNDFSFIDARGELLFPVRSYRDPRTRRLSREIYARIAPRELYMLSGNQLACFNTYMQLAAMVENGQGYLFRHADKLLMLPDLLMFFLCGERAMEYSLAAETQMLDLNTRQWIPRVLEAIGFPRRLFADLVMPATVLGKTRGAIGDLTGARGADCVAVCEHDTASAFLAAPVGRNAAILSSGTWALIGVEADGPQVCEFGYRRNIANEGSLPGHHRILKNVMGSWLIQELIRDFARDDKRFDYAQVQALALEARPFACMMDADDERFFTPGQMRAKVRAASLEACGRAPETPGEYFRTVYEALSFKYRQALEDLEALTGRRADEVAIIGGGSLDEAACRFACDALARPVTAGLADASAIGNILVQMLARGEIKNVWEGRRIVAASFAPRAYAPGNTALWTEKYQAFQNVLARLSERRGEA